LVQYQEGRVAIRSFTDTEHIKFKVMAFDAGSGLAEHTAPGEAVVFALEGEAVIGYEGVRHTLRAGENFCFAKDGRHYIEAANRFKMALLITL
ncbi:MAG: cupin domain-containing protein, partial [Lachnospiraceae bacterium]|nr:cupin domain-containing protein [Lachnospiraceae bacterium]